MSLVVVSSSPNHRTDQSLVGQCAILACSKIIEFFGSGCSPRNLLNFVKCGRPRRSHGRDGPNGTNTNAPVPEDSPFFLKTFRELYSGKKKLPIKLENAKKILFPNDKDRESHLKEVQTKFQEQFELDKTFRTGLKLRRLDDWTACAIDDELLKCGGQSQWDYKTYMTKLKECVRKVLNSHSGVWEVSAVHLIESLMSIDCQILRRYLWLGVVVEVADKKKPTTANLLELLDIVRKTSALVKDDKSCPLELMCPSLSEDKALKDRFYKVTRCNDILDLNSKEQTFNVPIGNNLVTIKEWEPLRKLLIKTAQGIDVMEGQNTCNALLFRMFDRVGRLFMPEWAFKELPKSSNKLLNDVCRDVDKELSGANGYTPRIHDDQTKFRECLKKALSGESWETEALGIIESLMSLQCRCDVRCLYLPLVVQTVRDRELKEDSKLSEYCSLLEKEMGNRSDSGFYPQLLVPFLSGSDDLKEAFYGSKLRKAGIQHVVKAKTLVQVSPTKVPDTTAGPAVDSDTKEEDSTTETAHEKEDTADEDKDSGASSPTPNPNFLFQMWEYRYTCNIPHMSKELIELWCSLANSYGLSDKGSVHEVVDRVCKMLGRALNIHSYFDPKLLKCDEPTTDPTVKSIYVRSMEKLGTKTVTNKDYASILEEAVDDELSGLGSPAWEENALKAIEHMMRLPHLIFQRCFFVPAILKAAGGRGITNKKLKEVYEILWGDRRRASKKFYSTMICPQLTQARLQPLFYSANDKWATFRSSVIRERRSCCCRPRMGKYDVPDLVDYTSTLPSCSNNADWALTSEWVQVGKKMYSWDVADLPKHWGDFWNSVAEADDLEKTSCFDVANEVCEDLVDSLDPDDEFDPNEMFAFLFAPTCDSTSFYSKNFHPVLLSLFHRCIVKLDGQCVKLGQFQKEQLIQVIEDEFDFLGPNWEVSAFSAVHCLMRLPFHLTNMRCMLVPAILEVADKKGIKNHDLSMAYKALMGDGSAPPEELLSRLICPYVTGGTDLESLFYKNDIWSDFRRKITITDIEDTNIILRRPGQQNEPSTTAMGSSQGPKSVIQTTERASGNAVSYSDQSERPTGNKFSESRDSVEDSLSGHPGVNGSFVDNSIHGDTHSRLRNARGGNVIPVQADVSQQQQSNGCLTEDSSRPDFQVL